MDATTRSVIDYFERINRIPRCSKQEQRISHWLQQWATRRGLGVRSDSAGNLVIQVPASEGFEQAPTLILQGHMDMVCEKRADSKHDFSRDPIRMVEEGPWLTARETTLGADNGIALAMGLALVDHPDVAHPPLELFFTVDEETGLTGALNMDPSLLSGKMLINLDSEDEGVFVVGCAGGRNATIHRPLEIQMLDERDALLGVSVQGLQGGHSGVDIAKHRANANTVMARLLRAGMTCASIRLVSLEGGSGRNVIPRGCEARIACRRDRVDDLKESIVRTAEIVKAEYRTTDPELTVRIDDTASATAGTYGATETDTAAALNLLMALPDGPAEMARTNPLLVQTSANLSLVEMRDGALVVTTNQRSSVPSRLDAICLKVEAVGRLAGASVEIPAGYPPWPMNPTSPLLDRCQSLYRKLFDAEPAVQIMHAGLECGVIGERLPGVDMVSLGPTMENPHSPSERLYLPSVEKVWRLMVALLASFEG